MVTLHNQIEVPKDPAKPDPNNLTKVEVLGAAVGDADGITRERIFVGPKALDVLESVHSNTPTASPAAPTCATPLISASSALSPARCSSG